MLMLIRFYQPIHSLISEVIDLYANQLGGRIPSELATLPKLRKLDLHDNNLVGEYTMLYN